MLALLTTLIVFQALYLAYLNRRNVSRRRAAGKLGAHVDYSLESSRRWAALDAKRVDGEAGTAEEYNAKAFMDL